MEVLAQLFAWFADTEQWSGVEGIPTRVWQHMWYALVASAAAAIGLPVGLGLGHLGRGPWWASTSPTSAGRSPRWDW